MKKLKQFLDCIYEGKNKKLSLFEIREIEYIYETLLIKKQVETLCQKASEICKISGLFVFEKGIGWQIEKI